MRKSLSILLLAAAPAWATADRPLKATFTEARGDVRVSTGPGGAWEPAERGMTVAADARVQTGADGGADLLFEDGTALRVEKNASLTLQAARESGGWREYLVRLWSGRLLSQVAKKGDNPVRYKVQTPVAVAAVRGTEFTTDASPEDTRLAVFEGAVETQSLQEDKPLGEAVTVSPDQELALARGRAAGRPGRISRAMQDYHRGAAALFRARIDLYRRDMSRLQRLQGDYMERRRRRLDRRMRENGDAKEDSMRRFRRELRRRNQKP